MSRNAAATSDPDTGDLRGNPRGCPIVGSVMELTCPKCQGVMRSYERSDVTVDQCTECRGIFLDRGELERLIDADARFNAGSAPAAPPPPAQTYAPAPPQPQYGGHDGYGHKPHKKRKSFIEELFD